jgi:hypothetical protein
MGSMLGPLGLEKLYAVIFLRMNVASTIPKKGISSHN